MENTRLSYKIGAVIVLYNPASDLLVDCIESIVDQVDEICVIDNSKDNHSSLFRTYGVKKVHYNPLGKNIGIASAQNIGIKYFQDKNYDFIIFSDQDSVSSKSLVQNLIDGYLKLSEKNDISCIGPMPINRKSRQPYLYKECVIEKKEDLGLKYNVMHSIISSYSLVPVSNFSEVGLMNERLFIDFVDQEWCWRAAAYNKKKSIMLAEIEIEHELGVSSLFMGHRINVSSPFRMYYQTRNLLWLCRKSYVPVYWKTMNMKKIIMKFFYYSIVPKERFHYLVRMLRGFSDGIFKHL